MKKNVNSPQLTSVLPLLGGAGFTANQLDSLLGIALGADGGAIAGTNYVAGLQARAALTPK